MFGTHNNHAIKLYEKCGFKVEGKKRKAIFLNNQYLDILEMGLLKNEFFKIRAAKFKNFFLNCKK